MDGAAFKAADGCRVKGDMSGAVDVGRVGFAV